MPRLIPAEWPAESPRSETLVREAAEALSDQWIVLSNLRWLDRTTSPQDGETDFIFLHPAYGGLVVEVKGGALSLQGGTWWTVDVRGRRRALGPRGPYQQAATSKHVLRRRIAKSCPVLANRLGHLVCFVDGAPRGDMGAEAPEEATLSGYDLDHLEDHLIRASEYFRGSSADLTDNEIAVAVEILAPTAEVSPHPARQAATFRIRLDAVATLRVAVTSEQLKGIEALRGNQRLAVHGPAGSGKTLVALRRAHELLAEGAQVTVLCSSAQLVGYYRDALRAAYPGRSTVGRFRELTDSIGFIADADAVLIDEAQNLTAEEMDSLPNLLRSSEGAIYLFADLDQIRDPDRRAAWQVPFDHGTHYLIENLRNSHEIVAVLNALDYRGISATSARSDVPVEFFAIGNGAQATAAAVEIVYDLIHEDEIKPGQIGIVTDMAREVADLCTCLELSVSTDVWAFGHSDRDRLDVGNAASFQGLERDVVVAVEPTIALSPAALREPPGTSSAPRSDIEGITLDLKSVVAAAASRARSRLILVGGQSLRAALGLAESDRVLRGQIKGSQSHIEIYGIAPGLVARARGTRRGVFNG